MIRATFVMEQHLGHQTYYHNLLRFVDQSSQIKSYWVPVTYNQTGTIWDYFAFLPTNIHGTLRGRAEVRRGLSQTKSEVAFFNTQVPAVLGGNLVSRQPYVISTDITPVQYDQMSQQYGHQPDHPGPMQRYKHRVNVNLLRNAARLLPWSTWTRDSLITDYGVTPERIEVVPPGVDTDHWTPGTEHNSGPLRILFVGGDLHRKGGDLLLRAFRELPSGTAELHLVTRTPVSRAEDIHAYHNLQPNSPELIRLFQTSDVFVLPTAAEAFGIAAAEASAAGIATIVTAVGGLTDIVVDGETGFLVPPGNLETLVSRLRLLADDSALRSRLGRAARQRAETHFNARRNAERIITCILNAAEIRDNKSKNVQLNL
ncbi:MAG: glycosyltransferase family 4 protein [Chloroflexaceae bacterium]